MQQGYLKQQRNSKGVTVIEVVIGTAIISTVVIMILLSMAVFFDAREKLLFRTSALYLAEEGIEMVRYLRDEDWNALIAAAPVDTTYYLDVATTTVAVTATPEVINGEYYRQFELRSVWRDSVSDDIVASSSGSNYVDTGSREVYMEVGYPGGTTTLQTIITNIFDL